MVTLDTASADLADAIEQALPGWVERSVARLAGSGPGRAQALAGPAAAAGREAAAAVGAQVRELLQLDVEQQRATPLGLLRGAVAYPTAVLRAAAVAPVARSAERARLFPDDVYDLAPAAFADVDPALAGPGLAWGVHKAATVLGRQQSAAADGRRR